MTKGYRDLVAEAEEVVETLSVAEARALLDADDVVFIDVRDPRERDREGAIPGAQLCPRGMLEFWIDPTSPYHRAPFDRDARFVFYCSLGWRSALATRTAQEMGLEDVAHVGGGFTAWREQGGPVERRD
jgi:rhodanese-related sulfurtransferase